MKVALSAAPAAALAALLALAVPAEAQCFAPDFLDGPCCAQVQLNLPPLGGFGIEGKGLCYVDCDPAVQNTLKLEGMPAAPALTCGQFVRPFRVTDTTSGAVLLEGDLVHDYTRTWSEISAATTPPTQYQVWRFVTKVDLRQMPGVAPACPSPACLPAAQSAFFYGYYDLALNCATGAFEHALVLFHGCDRQMHSPALSDRPGVFHPTETYAIVGPDTPANPFVPASPPPTGGPVVAEGMRDVVPPGAAGVCQSEEPVLAGIYLPLGSGCFCPLALAPTQQAAKYLDLLGACTDPIGTPGSVRSLNAYPTAPWIHMLSTAIGRWTTAASYPGPEAAWVVEGALEYVDPCTSITGIGATSYVEIHYGAETDNGYSIAPDPVTGVALPDEFLDTASNYSVDPFTPIAPPLLGSVRPTDHLIYVNTP